VARARPLPPQPQPERCLRGRVDAPVAPDRHA
jgi:hypothetical protein